MRLGVLLLLTLVAGEAQAQTYAPPRTADGRPDFGGVWAMGFITRIERPKNMAGPEVSDEEGDAAAAKMLERKPEIGDPDFDTYDVRSLARVRGKQRTSLLVEPAQGGIPFSTKALEGVDRSDMLWEKGFDNPEERDSGERCISGFIQAPIRTLPMPLPLHFVQTADAMVIHMEDVSGLRIVHINAPPPPDVLRSRDGWSGGRWEGDTLVVETTHLAARDSNRVNMGRALQVSEASRIIERFTRIADDELLYTYTIEDPALYTAPWRVEFSLTRADHDRVHEYACHEANYSLANMLKSGRAADRAREAAEKAKAQKAAKGKRKSLK